MQIGMIGTGLDAVAHVGRQAEVVGDITGEADETLQRIELLLRLNLDQTWPLGELPATLGRSPTGRGSVSKSPRHPE